MILDQSHIISLEGQKLEMMLVSMGNPHAVIFMPPEEGSFKTWDMRRAAVISSHSDFPDGVNVELVQVYSETGMKIRVWERGEARRRFPVEVERVRQRPQPSWTVGPSGK